MVFPEVLLTTENISAAVLGYLLCGLAVGSDCRSEVS